MLSWTRGIHIWFRQSPILGIGNFRRPSLNYDYKCLHENSSTFVGTGFEFYAENAVPYKCQNSEKGFLSALARFSYFRQLPLHVNA